MGVNNYQTILRIELNDQICYSEHHLMVPEHFYCWVAGSFKLDRMLTDLALSQDEVSLSWTECSQTLLYHRMR